LLPAQVLEPKFNTDTKMPLEIESIVRQLKDQFSGKKKEQPG
jgi:hypothetical protein